MGESNEKMLLYKRKYQNTLTWTAGVLWSCVSWRRTSRPVSLSCGSIPVQSLLYGGRTPAGPAVTGYETQTAAPSIWIAPPAGYGSLSIKNVKKKHVWVTCNTAHSLSSTHSHFKTHEYIHLTYYLCLRWWTVYSHVSHTYCDKITVVDRYWTIFRVINNINKNLKCPPTARQSLLLSCAYGVSLVMMSRRYSEIKLI